VEQAWRSSSTKLARRPSCKAGVANVGNLTVRWIPTSSGVQEEVVLQQCPATNQVTFLEHLQGVKVQADGAGGYVLRDRKNEVVYQLGAPTVRDAAGRIGTATLVIGRNPGGHPT